MKIDSVRPVTIILVGEDQAAKYIFAKKLSERTGFSIVDLNTRKADDYYPIDDVSDDEIDECRAYNRYQYVDDVLSSDMISTSYIYYISDNMVDSYNYEKFVDLLNGFDLVLNLRAPKSVSPTR